jgi:uncharacterized membrane protein YqjE
MPDGGSGLLGSVKRLGLTLVSIVATRLELFANEWEEERLRFMQMLFFSLCAVFFLGLALLLLTLFVVVLFWDEHRLAAMAGLGLLYGVLGMAMALLARSRARSKSKLFSASLAELAQDREQLGAHNE